jgi:hypothetical protein
MRIIFENQFLQEIIVKETEASKLDKEFIELARKWKEETAGFSSIISISLNGNYQRIIAKGFKIVPLILRELQIQPDHWFWALTYLTDENPVKEEDEGNIEKMADAWIRWGKINKLI